LGWDPVPVFARAFYRGYSSEYIPEITWLPPRWLGSIQTGYLHQPEVRASFDVLNELVRIHMVQRTDVPGGFRYNLTMRALDYYWDDDPYRVNPGGEPYLCYSTIVPQRVLWSQPIHTEEDRNGRKVQVFRAAFQWSVSADADWANDALLRSHSVVLPPTQSPTIAKFVSVDGDWDIQNIYSRTQALPRVVDASVWPSLPFRVSSRK
jgi:hypothetical protein